MGEAIRVTGNTGPFAGGAAALSSAPLHEVAQHGTIGDFIGSSLEGVESGFIRCVYNAKNQSGSTVTLLCEKMEGCCISGCCPKDQFWMAGLMVLLVFVLVVVCVGAVVMIVCYQRSKVRQRREEKQIYESARMGSEMAQTGPALYARPIYAPAQPAASATGSAIFHPAQQPPTAQNLYGSNTVSRRF